MADAARLAFCNAAGVPIAHVSLMAPAVDASAPAPACAPIVTLSGAEATTAGEATVQLLEGLRYEYECDGTQWRLALRGNDTEGIVSASRLPQRAHSGSLQPGLNTGLMQLALEDCAGQACAWADVEVRSRKLSYKADYRMMMQDISERCVDLLGDWRAASKFRAETDAGADAKTAGQRFAFVRALLEAPSFRDALHRITTHPHRRWTAQAQLQPLAHGVRPSRNMQVQIARGVRRSLLPPAHPLASRIPTVPEHLTAWRAKCTEDTPENRFVKFALCNFQHFLDQVAHKVLGSQEPRLTAEVKALQNQLDLALASDVLRHVGQPEGLPLGSPVLQRKEGYREVLQAWLKFAMAAKLVWQGGQDVYGAGQRDVATLYEYWVFFCLLDMVAEIFTLDKPAGKSLLEETADGMGLKLRAGKFLALDGQAQAHGRELRVQLSYNRSFRGSGKRAQAGSWTQAMRPDCTLSLWPAQFSADDAESQELMVHVHFDAKYRVEDLKGLLGDPVDTPYEPSDDQVNAALAAEAGEQRRGNYRRADLLKMHAYRDAIRRTHGAYVLYPGTENQALRGFHEVLPGLGAFALRPGAGCHALKTFLREVVAHVCNRASTAEQQSYATYSNYRTEEPCAQYQPFAERVGKTADRHTPPRQTFVAVGWCKGAEHLKWIRARGLYNFRMGTNRGSLALSADVAGAAYLLLHGQGNAAIPGLLRVKDPSQGPQVWSGQDLVAHGYPGTPSQAFYLVYEVETAPEFEGAHWAVQHLAAKPGAMQTGQPFTCSLHELLQCRVDASHP